MAEARLSGRAIKLVPNLPNPLLAISLPRCGCTNEHDALDPRISLKVVARTIKLSLEFSLKMLFAVSPRAFSHIGLVTVITCMRVSIPPIL